MHTFWEVFKVISVIIVLIEILIIFVMIFFFTVIDDGKAWGENKNKLRYKIIQAPTEKN